MFVLVLSLLNPVSPIRDWASCIQFILSRVMLKNGRRNTEFLCRTVGLVEGKTQSWQLGELGRQCSHLCGAEGAWTKNQVQWSCLTLSTDALLHMMENVARIWQTSTWTYPKASLKYTRYRLVTVSTTQSRSVGVTSTRLTRDRSQESKIAPCLGKLVEIRPLATGARHTNLNP